jgi:hypothetical protein
LRNGERGALFAPILIGVFYVVSGVATAIYTGTPFFWVFVVLGGLLLVSSQILRCVA